MIRWINRLLKKNKQREYSFNEYLSRDRGVIPDELLKNIIEERYKARNKYIPNTVYVNPEDANKILIDKILGMEIKSCEGISINDCLVARCNK